MKNSGDNLLTEIRIGKDWFSSFEWKDVLFALIHTFMLRGATVELEVVELITK